MHTNDSYKLFKIVQQHVGRTTWWREAEDQLTFVDVFTLMILMWSDLLDTNPLYLSRRICSNYSNDILPGIDVVKTLKLAHDTLLREGWCGFSYSSLKAKVPGCGKLLFALKFVFDRSTKGVSPSDFWLICQCLSFLPRMNVVDKDIEIQSARKWARRYNENKHPRSYDNDVINIMSEDLKMFNIPLDIHDFHHGKGTTSELTQAGEPISLKRKYSLMQSDMLTRYLSDRLGMNWDWPDGLNRTSTLLFVPKSATAKRVVLPEPTSLQYIQQGTGRWYAKNLQGMFPKVINFADQSRAHQLARIGSIDNSIATIDLSSASDSITHRFVTQVSQDTRSRTYYECGRSTHFRLPDGLIVPSYQAFGMGSNYCFPCETHTFLSYVRAVCRGYSLDNIFIEGDDITVPTDIAEDVMSLLSQDGYEVNYEKSFYTTNFFRETCGKYFYHGFDVTPVRVPRNIKAFSHRSAIRASQYPQLIDLANSLYGISKTCRGAIIGYLMCITRDKRPIFCNMQESTGIQSNDPTNYHLRHFRINDASGYIVGGGLEAHKSYLDGPEGLQEWLRSADSCPDRSQPLRVVDRVKRTEWTAVTYPLS